jgi:methionyl-tRNA formyltransferase
LLAGDKETGVTIMQIDEGLDTGDMLYQTKYLLQPEDTSGIVHEALADLGAKALITALGLIELGQAKSEVQNNLLTTYAAKLKKDEACINWRESAHYVDRQVRAFNPWPIAYTHLTDSLLKVWEGTIVSTESHRHPAGLIIGANEQGIDVATKQGIYRMLTVQIPGGKPMAAKFFLNARRDSIIPFKTFLTI